MRASHSGTLRGGQPMDRTMHIAFLVASLKKNLHGLGSLIPGFGAALQEMADQVEGAAAQHLASAAGRPSMPMQGAVDAGQGPAPAPAGTPPPYAGP